MAISDHYKVLLKGTYLGVPCLNRFYYGQIAGTGTAEEMHNAFVLDVLPAMLDVVSDQYVVTEIESINLDNLADFYESAIIGANGTRVGEGTAPFVTWGFRLDRDTRLFRPGRKSLVGVAEADVANGVAIPAMLPLLDLVATAFGNNISEPVESSVYKPQLIREATGVGILAAANITGASYVRVSTQNSRKFSS